MIFAQNLGITQDMANFLTPWSRVLSERLKGPHLNKKFPAFYGNRRLITAFPSARHLFLVWAKAIQSKPSQYYSLRIHFYFLHCFLLVTEIFLRHPCREPINTQSITILCLVATYKRVVNECHSLCFKSGLKILEWLDPSYFHWNILIIHKGEIICHWIDTELHKIRQPLLRRKSVFITTKRNSQINCVEEFLRCFTLKHAIALCYKHGFLCTGFMPEFFKMLNATVISGTVTKAWRVLGLRMEEWPPIWKVAATILNKQSRTADMGLPSSLGDGQGANNSLPQKRIMLRNIPTENLGTEY